MHRPLHSARQEYPANSRLATGLCSALHIVLIVLGTGCAIPDFEMSETWFAGDLHVHTSIGSNDTDGLGSVSLLAETMDARGLDFVFVTDHSNSAGSMHCEDVEDCPNLGPEFPARDEIEALGLTGSRIWVGSEISPSAQTEPNGHVGCLPMGTDDFDAWEEAFIDRPVGAVTGAQALEQCQSIGGFAIVNHPDAPATWIRWDETADTYDGLEIYNGGGRFAYWDATTIETRWFADLRAGRKVVGVGGSDVHRFGVEPPGDFTNPALGYPTTWVAADDLEDVPAALAAGRVIVGEPGSWVNLRAWRAGAETVGVGETLSGGRGVTWLRIEANVGAPDLRLQILEVVTGELLVDRAPVAGSTVAAEVEANAGIYVARLWPDTEDIDVLTGGVAITNPIWVE